MKRQHHPSRHSCNLSMEGICHKLRTLSQWQCQGRRHPPGCQMLLSLDGMENVAAKPKRVTCTDASQAMFSSRIEAATSRQSRATRRQATPVQKVASSELIFNAIAVQSLACISSFGSGCGFCTAVPLALRCPKGQSPEGRLSRRLSRSWHGHEVTSS